MTLLGGPGAFLKPTGAPRFLIKYDQTDSLSGLSVVSCGLWREDNEGKQHNLFQILKYSL